MSIFLPIFFFAVALGLFVRRMTPLLWTALVVWIVLVMAVQWVRG